MRHTGKSFAWEDGTDRITDSTVNDTRISINWWDGGKTGHMELHSADGISYQGRFGYPILDSHRLVEFTRFNSEPVKKSVSNQSRRLRMESETACHVVGDGEPRRSGFDLFETSNQELP